MNTIKTVYKNVTAAITLLSFAYSAYALVVLTKNLGAETTKMLISATRKK